MSGKIDIASVPVRRGTAYPSPFDTPCTGRASKALGDTSGLTQFGVVLLTLQPGVWSSQRHWHTHEDEFVYVLSGSVTMVTDAGSEPLEPGDCAGFPANGRNGHHFINESNVDALLLIVGSRHDADRGGYSDIDMQFLPFRQSGGKGYATKSGQPLDDNAAQTLERMIAAGLPVKLDEVTP
jgi:uncharacterized cupin superfamily protein